MRVNNTNGAPAHTGPVPQAVVGGGWVDLRVGAVSAIEASDFGRKGDNARFMVEVTAYHG